MPEDETAKLKKLLTEQMLENAKLKDRASINGDARGEAGSHRLSLCSYQMRPRRACSVLGVGWWRERDWRRTFSGFETNGNNLSTLFILPDRLCEETPTRIIGLLRSTGQLHILPVEVLASETSEFARLRRCRLPH